MPSTPANPRAALWPTLAQARETLLNGFDTNRDGALTRAEIVTVLDPSGRHAEDLNPVVQHLVDLMDANQDGIVASAELDAALKQLDRNGDGQLSPADMGSGPAHEGLAPVLAALLHAHLPGPRPGAPNQPAPPVPPEPPGPPARQAPTLDQVVNALLSRFDGNKDGAIALSELLAVLDPKGHRAKLDATLADLVQAVDTDHNGAMSRAEMLSAVASLDTNHDGLLNHDDHLPGPPPDEGVDLIGVLLPHLRDFDVGTLGHFG